MERKGKYMELRLWARVRNIWGRLRGFGGCLRCGDTWDRTPYHSTYIGAGSSCFPLCERCWRGLSPQERLPYYERLVIQVWKQESRLDEVRQAVTTESRRSRMSDHQWEPKEYHDHGRVLQWGQDLTGEQKAALRGGEVFTLLNESGEPHSIVLMDSYGTIREKRVRLGDEIS
jgi:hypothetical protein